MNWCSFGLHRWTKWENTKETYYQYIFGATGIFNVMCLFKRSCTVCEIENYKSVIVKKENIF